MIEPVLPDEFDASGDVTASMAHLPQLDTARLPPVWRKLVMKVRYLCYVGNIEEGWRVPREDCRS